MPLDTQNAANVPFRSLSGMLGTISQFAMQPMSKVVQTVRILTMVLGWKHGSRLRDSGRLIAVDDPNSKLPSQTTETALAVRYVLEWIGSYPRRSLPLDVALRVFGVLPMSEFSYLQIARKHGVTKQYICKLIGELTIPLGIRLPTQRSDAARENMRYANRRNESANSHTATG